jgi:transcriptional regulator with XRE-family HTH domain/tetratricopeptide (TPR) repeat protein
MSQIDPEVGRRLKALRTRAGFSRERLASFAGLSPSLIKMVEHGKRALTLRAAQRLSPHLGVQDLADLFGPVFRFSLEGRPSHPTVPEVRRALTAWQLRVEGPPPTPEFVSSALHAAWRTWHTSPQQRTEAGGVLPTLIHQAQTAARLHEGNARRQSLANLAEVYHLAQAYLAWHGEQELVWLTVDRGMTAAQEADDPLTIGWSVFYAAHLLRAVGRWEEAVEQLQAAVELVRPRLNNDGTEAAATLASLHLCAALTKARAGDQGAWHDWQQAVDIVQRLPAGYVHPRHPVSTFLVDVYATMLAVELCDPEEARRRAHALDPDSIPSTAWRASHLVSLARGADQEGSAEGTLALLQRAVNVSPEVVQFSVPARDLVSRLLVDAGATIRPDVTALAARIGLPTS